MNLMAKKTRAELAARVRAEQIHQTVYRHRGEELNACVNDMARALLCQQWAEEMRDKFYDDKLHAGIMGGISAEYQYVKSVTARDTAAMEQMYHRWMSGYLGMWRARVEIEKELGLMDWVDELNALWASRNPGTPNPVTGTASASAGATYTVDPT